MTFRHYHCFPHPLEIFPAAETPAESMLLLKSLLEIPPLLPACFLWNE